MIRRKAIKRIVRRAASYFNDLIDEEKSRFAREIFNYLGQHKKLVGFYTYILLDKLLRFKEAEH
jgi:hypothetical protein